tara:strand:- start:1205 stop:1459 length:255 start_codon:yes stop_codon:yes gene_type:complete
MKDKNLPNNFETKSLEELTKQVNNIIQTLEKEEDLEKSINKYQELIKLNNLIEKKFQNTSKKISLTTKEKIKRLLSTKNDKKIK